MKNRRKILPRIILLAVVLVLITALAFANVYAKYVTNKGADANTRPAAFELIVNAPADDKMEINFAKDGEPGSPLGYSVAYRDYDFTVKTDASEVASNYEIRITFSEKVANIIALARADKAADGVVDYTYTAEDANGNSVTITNTDGIWCDYEVLKWDPTRLNGKGEYVPLVYDITRCEFYENGGQLQSNPLNLDSNGKKVDPYKPLIFSYTEIIEPGENPSGTPETETEAKYRLRLTFYNNTKRDTTNGNGQKYFFSSNAIDIEVSSTQINPGYVGSHVYS